MTDPLTAEWCHDVAMLYDGRAGLQRSAGQHRGATQDQKISAALRITARVLDESAFTNIYDILKDLTFTHTDETGDVSVVGIGHAAEAILAYLKGEVS